MKKTNKDHRERPVTPGSAAVFPDVAELPVRPDLPDPLAALDGTRVATREDWIARRRPELKALFEHYMYGRAPAAPGAVRADIEREDRALLGGRLTKREIAIRLGPSGDPVLHLLLLVPNAARGPVPVFVGANFHGNHTLLADPGIALPRGWVRDKSPGSVENRATDAGRGAELETWSVEAVTARGYALATFYCGDVDPDRNDFTDGVHAAYAAPGAARGPHDWGTIRAWAWGLSRAVDYLVTDPAIDPGRVIAVGHSRLGKTALLAAAYDERIAMAVPIQSGCGGAAPSRTAVGETVARINTTFPHWFCDTFKRFNDGPERLPFDQHCLAALVAPRPLLFANAEEDTWANPAGQFEMLRAAEPVYRLLGAGGLEAAAMPGLNRLSAGTLGYFIRPGRHEVRLVDWQAILDFADLHPTRGRAGPPARPMRPG